MNINTDLNSVFKGLKRKLAKFEAIGIVPSDLGESTFNPNVYSDEIYLIRSEIDALVYIHDESDDTLGEVSVHDLKIILNNTASRMVRQIEQAAEMEKFLSE